MIDSPDNRVNEEHREESDDSKHNIRKLHCTSTRRPLPDLNRKCDHNNQRRDVDPRNHHHMICSRQHLKDRIDHKDHQHSQRPDD